MAATLSQNSNIQSQKPWPKTWIHRETKKKVRVMPWWECLEPIVADNDDFKGIAVGKEIADGRKFRIGAIVQIGWLIENEQGVWFGVSLDVEEIFDTNLGESVAADPEHAQDKGLQSQSTPDSYSGR